MHFGLEFAGSKILFSYTTVVYKANEALGPVHNSAIFGAFL
jgi:hypothetical protein